MAANDEAWAKVRHDYETTLDPMTQIAARHRVNVNTAYVRRKAEGWADAHRNDPSRPKPKRAVALTGSAGARARDLLIGRFYRAISATLAHCRSVRGMSHCGAGACPARPA